jgi:hypothetical protein
MGFTTWILLVPSSFPFNFAFQIVAKLLCSSLCLFAQLLTYIFWMESGSNDFLIVM